MATRVAVEAFERSVDARLDALLSDLRGRDDFPLSEEAAFAFLRAAYGRGYTDSLKVGASRQRRIPEVVMSGWLTLLSRASLLANRVARRSDGSSTA